MQNSETGETGKTALTREEKRGIAAGIFCYALWGLFPAYWKLLDEVNAGEIIVHRIIWCFVTTALVVLIARLDIVSLIRSPRAWKILAPAAVLITANWSIFIFAVSIDRIVETSIGYYLNPLVTIVFGVVFFRERLTRIQLIAVALCAIGLAYFTWSYGHFPWIAVCLALTFAAYGALKKKGGYPPVEALAFENAIMVLPAIIAGIVIAHITGSHAFLGSMSAYGWLITVLLIVGGPVTALPLILFARAANDIPLSLLGFIQYISPTLSLLLGVLVYGEPFTLAHAVCLGFIWTGIALVSAETVTAGRGNDGA